MTSAGAVLRDTVENHPLLAHPFFTLAVGEGLDGDVVRAWALQDRHVAYAFPRIIARIISSLAVEDTAGVRARMPMVQNLWEEVGEGDAARAHSTLMDALLLSIGVPPDELLAPKLASTAEFLSYQMALADDDPIAALAVFCYANEYLALREYPPIQTAARRAFPEVDVRFFEANWEADGRHTELAEETVQLLAHESDVPHLAAAVRRALDIRIRLYDDLMARVAVTAVRA